MTLVEDECYTFERVPDPSLVNDATRTPRASPPLPPPPPASPSPRRPFLLPPRRQPPLAPATTLLPMRRRLAYSCRTPPPFRSRTRALAPPPPRPLPPLLPWTKDALSSSPPVLDQVPDPTAEAEVTRRPVVLPPHPEAKPQTSSERAAERGVRRVQRDLSSVDFFPFLLCNVGTGCSILKARRALIQH